MNVIIKQRRFHTIAVLILLSTGFLPLAAQSAAADSSSSDAAVQQNEAVSSSISDFNQLWQLALAGNPDLLEQRISLETARRNAELVMDSFIPNISANAGMNRNSGFFPESDGITASESDRWSLSASVSASLSLNPGLSRDQREEVFAYDLALLDMQQAENDVYAQLLDLAAQIVSAEEEVEILSGDRLNTQNRLEQIQLQYDRGLRSERELLSARISLARIEPQIQRQSSTIQGLYNQLKQMLGLALSNEISLSGLQLPAAFGEAGLPDEQELYSRLQASTSVRRLSLQLEQTRLAYQRTVTEARGLSPSFGINLGLGWNQSLSNIIDGSAFDLDVLNDSFGLSFGLSIPISAYIPGSSQDQRIESSRLNLEARERAYHASLENLENQLRTLLMDIQLAQTNSELNALTLELQRQDFAAATRSYEAGTLSLLELDEARQSLRDAELAARQEEQSYNSLLIDLRALLDGYPQ